MILSSKEVSLTFGFVKLGLRRNLCLCSMACAVVHQVKYGAPHTRWIFWWGLVVHKYNLPPSIHSNNAYSLSSLLKLENVTAIFVINSTFHRRYHKFTILILHTYNISHTLFSIDRWLLSSPLWSTKSQKPRIQKIQRKQHLEAQTIMGWSFQLSSNTHLLQFPIFFILHMNKPKYFCTWIVCFV